MDVQAKNIEHNPTADELRSYAEKQPIAEVTADGLVNITTVVTARSKNSTFIVSDDPSQHTDPVIGREEFARVADRQDEHFSSADVIVLDGYIGDHPDARVATRLVVEKTNANLAAMQRNLYFPPGDGFEPEFHVLYTPNLPAPGYPDDLLIAVDLDNGVTRVLGSDYFGESKMGGLRMWDALQYRKGGLAMHSGLKSIGIGDERRVGLIVGLSGTGKTTTTFSNQGDETRPSQDDFVAIYPDRKVYGTELGTFAKVYGLTPESEPVIWAGCESPDTYLENVKLDREGRPDYFDRSHTENSRAIIKAADLPGFLAPGEIDRADFLLILNRSQGIVPAVAKLGPAQAAAYFMLGETTGTSAGGAAEAGKFLRVPGTNPFFCYRHEWQANRLFELMADTPLEVYVLNTGRIGGPDEDERSRKIRPEHSTAILEGIARGTIEWDVDPQFGYLVAEEVPGVDQELLQPWRLYERQGRKAEYETRATDLLADRRGHLKRYADLEPEIAAAM